MKLVGYGQSPHTPMWQRKKDGKDVGDYKMVVSRITLRTKNGLAEYTLKDFPADGYFPDDDDGLVDYVSRRS